MDLFSSNDTNNVRYQMATRLSPNQSPQVPGASQHSAIFSASPVSFHDDLLSFLAYIKTRQIPILSVALPDVRSVLGRGASFFVNGAEMPDSHVDEVTGCVYEKSSIVALKRAVVPAGTTSIKDGLAKRINLLFNEVLTMRHPPLAAHPNIVQLLGIGFEVEGPESDRNVMPILVPECAELGNLAEVLETAKRQDRPLSFKQKLAFCVDVAHGLEALHACDIIHGDVKCENVLVFENEASEEAVSNEEGRLICKLIDFGYSHLDGSSNGFPLGGSPPWHAPECLAGNYFKIETAKKTDIYSFGLLVWRLMLDGDPFSSLSFEGETEKEQRARRNDFIAGLKQEDKLADYVSQSLTSSTDLTEQQAAMLSRVIQCTLAKDPAKRELDIPRLIRLLSPDFWYKSRQLMDPERIRFHTDIKLLDIEKYFLELRKADGVVKEHIARSLHDYAKGLAGDKVQNAGAAYQLAVCYALGFGVAFEPEECLKWLSIAAMGGSASAQSALPVFAHVFKDDLKDYVIPMTTGAIEDLSLDSERSTEPIRLNITDTSAASSDIERRGGKFYLNGKARDGASLLLKAAEDGHYDNMEMLLSNGVSGAAATEEGVTPLHFMSFWTEEKAKALGQRLIAAGGNINAIARRGSSIGGSPLMWAVSEDRQEHSRIILDLGGKPTISDLLGNSALSFSAMLHLGDHMRLLLSHIPPVEVKGLLHQLLVAAASGESRFSRIMRHGSNWKTVPEEILRLLQAWNDVFQEIKDWHLFLVAAIAESQGSTFGPSNTDIQLLFLDSSHIDFTVCSSLLGVCITTDNKPLFDGLVSRGVPTKWHNQDLETLLHLCAQNPNTTTTITYYAQQLLEFPDTDINARDSSGKTPFMHALLARKWDLAGFLLHKGADPFCVANSGYNVLGLIIQTQNLGAAKWAFKYSNAGDLFREKAFIVHPKRNISAIQEAARLELPRAHGMKTEVSGLFLFVLANFLDRAAIDLRSDIDSTGVNVSALDIAAAHGNVHAVKALCKKDAHVASGASAVEQANLALRRCASDKGGISEPDPMLRKKNLERCVYILEHWANDPKGTEAVADGWTKLRTIDESHVRSSWEVIAWEWRVPHNKKGGS